MNTNDILLLSSLLSQFTNRYFSVNHNYRFYTYGEYVVNNNVFLTTFYIRNETLNNSHFINLSMFYDEMSLIHMHFEYQNNVYEFILNLGFNNIQVIANQWQNILKDFLNLNGNWQYYTIIS